MAVMQLLHVLPGSHKCILSLATPVIFCFSNCDAVFLKPDDDDTS